MPLVTTKEMFEKAYKGGYAIGAFNVDNIDIMKAVLRAAEKTQSPVIIAISSGALKHANLTMARFLKDLAVVICVFISPFFVLIITSLTSLNRLRESVVG